MNQYTKNKDITLKKLSNNRRLLETFLVILSIFAFYLMITLISYNPSDPSWSQTATCNNSSIHNLGGKVGAWFADTLFFTLGVLAYTFPPIILFLCWKIFSYRNKCNYMDLFNLSLRLIGSLALLFSSCSLATLNVNDLYHFSSGGIIGSLLSDAIFSWLNSISAVTLTLLCIWALGFTLFIGWSWLTIAEKIGEVVLECLAIIANFSQRNYKENHSYRCFQNIKNNKDDAHYFSNDDPRLQPSDEAITALWKETVRGSYGLADLIITPHQPYKQSIDDILSISPNESGSPHHVLSGVFGTSTTPMSASKTDQVIDNGARLDDFMQSDTENNGSRLLNWQRNLNTTRIPYNLTVQKQNYDMRETGKQNSPSLAFMPVLPIRRNDYNLQVKTGIGPELPRPTPVRIPTRRELASYGIKISSQQRTTLEERKEVPQAKDTLSCNDERWQSATYPSYSDSWTKGNPCGKNNNTALIQGNSFSQITMQTPDMDRLIHPFLIRQDHSRQKPFTSLPTMDLLTLPPHKKEPIDMSELEKTARLVEAKLADYRIKTEVVGISPGPVITRFELDLAPGVKASRISNLSRDLARSLSAMAVRVVEVIPGKPYVGLELPNKQRQTVYLREVLDCKKFHDTVSPLSLVLGKDTSGQPVIADLGKMPHLLIAGTTGSGKSVGVNAMILSILYKATPQEMRFIMIDPKMLELSVYEGIPHLLTEVVTDMKDAANALRWCVCEMERRYKLMSALGVRNLSGFNERIEQADAIGRPVLDPFWRLTDDVTEMTPILKKLPYIVVIIDEFADLMMVVGKKVEELIARLAQKARAAGIHLVLATQRPSVDIITGLIKANIPTRIAFTVSSKIDSRTILDQTGAESLLGIGDMLYLAPDSSLPIRIHGAFVRDEEVHAVVNDWKARGRPQYIDNIISGSIDENEGNGRKNLVNSDEELDPVFDQAVAFVIDKRRASISGVQRQFRIGYNRAARIVEQMELQGIISSPRHNGNREVLSPPLQE